MYAGLKIKQEVLIDIYSKVKLENIIKTYGRPLQINQAIEEAGELIVSLTKFKRHLADGSSDEKLKECIRNIIDEVADVEIMLNQLMLMFDCEKEVDERIEYKIARQIARIGDREGKNGSKN